MTIKVGDTVIYRGHGSKTLLRVDGFVEDAMSRKYVALTDLETGKACGTLRLGQVRLAEKEAI